MRQGFECHAIKSKAIEALEKHKKLHIESYKKAVEIYKKVVQERLESMLSRIKAGKRVPHTLALMSPVNYADAYDRLIRLLKTTTQTELLLDEQQYDCIFEDRWPWRGAYDQHTMLYLSGPTGPTGLTGTTGPFGGTGTQGFAGEGPVEEFNDEDLVPKDL